MTKYTRLRFAGPVVRMKKLKKKKWGFQNLTGKLTGKIPLERKRHRWEGNIRMDLKEIGINTRNWIESTQDRDPCECGIEPPCSISHGLG